MESVAYIAPGLIFLMMAAMWFRIRFRYQAPPDDPPGVRSVVEWTAPLLENQAEITAEEFAKLLVESLRSQGITADDPVAKDDVWTFLTSSNGISFRVVHRQPSGAPRQTVSRPVKIYFDTHHIRAWKNMSAAIGEVLQTQGARDVNWIRFEDHWNEAVEWAFDDPVD